MTPYRRRDWQTHPPYDYAPYRSTEFRAPQQELIPLAHTLSEITGPTYDQSIVVKGDSDLSSNPGTGQAPLGERIIMSGRVLDENKRPVSNTLIEIWQANSAGRYLHRNDQHDAPLDPNFIGAGRCCTNEKGEYRFISIKPGAYPWGNHHNAWRPAHIHLSLFGPAFATRLVTQLYFPGDPLLALDPIFNGVPCEQARNRLVASYDHELTEPGWALGYRFDIVLRGRDETPMENTE